MEQHRHILSPDTLLENKYQVKEQVGAGGMGAVYKAYYAAINRYVAVKVLLPQYVKNAEVVRRFNREARAAGAIMNDNICEVTDVGRTPEGAPFFVMPLLDGASLAQLMAQAPVALPRVVDIISQTLSALQAAHSANIVHRDLKPENIFVTKVGDREDFVKLLDFGISKIISDNTIGDLTRTGAVLGTSHYLAPEQAQGAKFVDHLADIYAMGVILYEAVTGQKPFEGESHSEILMKIVAEPFTPPTMLDPNIPKPIEKIVIKAMARDPAKRYMSASDMRSALEQAFDRRSDPAVDGATGENTTISATSEHDGWTPHAPKSGVEAGRNRVDEPAPGIPPAAGNSTHSLRAGRMPASDQPAEAPPTVHIRGHRTSTPQPQSKDREPPVVAPKQTPAAISAGHPPPSYPPPRRQSRGRTHPLTLSVFVVLIGGALVAVLLNWEEVPSNAPAVLPLASPQSGPVAENKDAPDTSEVRPQADDPGPALSLPETVEDTATATTPHKAPRSRQHNRKQTGAPSRRVDTDDERGQASALPALAKEPTSSAENAEPQPAPAKTENIEGRFETIFTTTYDE